MVLGISGSPRANGVTALAVKEVLASYEGDTKYLSLAGKKINGCISCLGCIHTNQCVIEDDFTEIAQAMLEAEAVVFGVPNYYGLPNALSHALWERCFCFRHQGNFLLKDKLGLVITTGYTVDDQVNPVGDLIEMFMKRNEMTTLPKFSIGAYSQCYDCQVGLTCDVGNVVRNHGHVDQVTKEMCPPHFAEQPLAIEKCRQGSRLLGKVLSAKSK